MNAQSAINPPTPREAAEFLGRRLGLPCEGLYQAAPPKALIDCAEFLNDAERRHDYNEVARKIHRRLVHDLQTHQKIGDYAVMTNGMLDPWYNMLVGPTPPLGAASQQPRQATGQGNAIGQGNVATSRKPNKVLILCKP